MWSGALKFEFVMMLFYISRLSKGWKFFFIGAVLKYMSLCHYPVGLRLLTSVPTNTREL